MNNIVLCVSLLQISKGLIKSKFMRENFIVQFILSFLRLKTVERIEKYNFKNGSC